MVRVPARCPLVITSNSGYPLDQNLYQTVKGLSAAARVCSEGGDILVASECADGIPAHGNFAKIMAECETPQALLDWTGSRPACILDQWQAQVLGEVLKRCRVSVFSSLPASEVEQCMMTPVAELQTAVDQALKVLGNDSDVAVLPHGPLTIPFVDE